MGERLKVLVIDYNDFPIRNATDVELLCDELAMVAEDYPEYWPIFRIIEQGESGTA